MRHAPTRPEHYDCLFFKGFGAASPDPVYWRSLFPGMSNETMPGRVILLVLVLLLVACEDGQEVSARRFAGIWQESYNNAAISWWYLGEDEKFFYLEEKRPSEEQLYKVPKSHIVINGIVRVRHGKSKKPVSLKTRNVEFM